jgi:hypothetical protein
MKGIGGARVGSLKAAAMGSENETFFGLPFFFPGRRE